MTIICVCGREVSLYLQNTKRGIYVGTCGLDGIGFRVTEPKEWDGAEERDYPMKRLPKEKTIDRK